MHMCPGEHHIHFWYRDLPLARVSIFMIAIGRGINFHDYNLCTKNVCGAPQGTYALISCITGIKNDINDH